MSWQPRAIIAASLLCLAGLPAARAESWIFRPSYFSHNDQGERVAQYEQPAPAYARVGENYLQSGFRHNHTQIRVGGSEDNVHVVETWGDGQWIRPYGEWEFPFRAGATPYGPWGNPQGPWTLPFDSWSNPYGLMRGYGNGYYGQPMMYAPNAMLGPGGPMQGGGYGGGPRSMPQAGPPMSGPMPSGTPGTGTP